MVISKLKYILSLLILLSLVESTEAQKEGNVWQFGFNAGLDFNTDEVTVRDDGAVDTWEGCSTVCDDMGNLLFYTNGVDVWNENHELMPNGSGLMGSFTSSQSALIVKKPGLNNIYYIFTTTNQAGLDGLRYSEVDMSLDGGLGDVTNAKNIFIVNRVVEKISAIRHENYSDFWLVTHLWDTTLFHSYHISENGIDFSYVESNVGSHVSGNGLTAMGYQKASQNGDRLALAHGGFLFDVEVFDFDNTTGEISNPIILDDYDLDKPYGVEFSPDGNLLYASIEGEPGTVYQYNLQAGSTQDIKNSKTVVGSGFAYGGALQLAPDGKIYHVGWDEYWLAAIESPNTLGTGCNYNLTGVHLNGKQTGIGLPNFPNSYLLDPAVSKSQVCNGDSTFFTIHYSEVDSAHWDFGDPESGEHNFSNELSPAHLYSSPGSYIVSLIAFEDGLEESRFISVEIYDQPQVYLGVDTIVCENNAVVLDAYTYHGYYRWQDNSVEPLYYATTEGTYYVDVIANSCFGSDTIYIEHCEVSFEMPNVFTPNNDGRNDRFRPLEYSDIREARLYIYDRWGKLIYETSNVKLGWDGNTKGKKCAAGTYYYIVNYKGFNNIEYQAKGSTTLLR